MTYSQELPVPLRAAHSLGKQRKSWVREKCGKSPKHTTESGKEENSNTDMQCRCRREQETLQKYIRGQAC